MLLTGKNLALSTFATLLILFILNGECFLSFPLFLGLMFLGEGIQPAAMFRPAELVDLAPTLLYGLGFPIARDLDGAILTPTFETGFLARQPLTFLPSYEALANREQSIVVH